MSITQGEILGTLEILRDRGPSKTSEVGWQLAGSTCTDRWAPKHGRRALLILRKLERSGLAKTDGRFWEATE